jgi:tyrosyl-tRNA synthetase
LNNVREANPQRPVGLAERLFDRHLLLRKGKRNYVLVTVL